MKLKSSWKQQLNIVQHISPDRIIGTSFQGYVFASINELTSLFGEPTRKNVDSLKTYLEWDLECDGIIFTIYDYNIWDTENEIDPNERVDFHIGGNSSYVAEFVQHLVKYNIN